MTPSGSRRTSALSPATSPSSSLWVARLLCVPLLVAYVLLLALALGWRPTVSDDILWAGWLFVGVIAPLAALRGLWLLGIRLLRDRTHRSIVDVGLWGLTMLALAIQVWLVARS
jgi:hypothetical protein